MPRANVAGDARYPRTRWARASWLLHSVHRLCRDHSVSDRRVANLTKRISLSCKRLRDIDVSDMEMLPQEGRLVGKQVGNQRWMVDREMVAVVVSRDTAGCLPGDILGMARIHQRLASRYAYQQRRRDAAGCTFSARNGDAGDTRRGDAVVE